MLGLFRRPWVLLITSTLKKLHSIEKQEAFPWGKAERSSGLFAFALALALIIPTFIRQSQNSITENEPKVELTLEEAMNDKTFGRLFPKKILEGYVLEDAPRHFGYQRLC